MPLNIAAPFIICSPKKENDGIRMSVPEEKGIAYCTTETIFGPAHQYKISMPRKETLNKADADQGYQDDLKVGKFGSLEL